MFRLQLSHITFVMIHRETISMVILTLSLIQEGQLLIVYAQILVNRLEIQAFPGKMCVD